MQSKLQQGEALSPHADTCQACRHPSMLQVPRQRRQVAMLLNKCIKQIPSSTTAAACPQLLSCLEQHSRTPRFLCCCCCCGVLSAAAAAAVAGGKAPASAPAHDGRGAAAQAICPLDLAPAAAAATAAVIVLSWRVSQHVRPGLEHNLRMQAQHAAVAQRAWLVCTCWLAGRQILHSC